MTQDIYAILDAERNLTTDLRDYKKLCLISSVKVLEISVEATCNFFGYSISSYHRIKKELISAAQNQNKRAEWGGRRKAYLSSEQENKFAKELATLSEAGGFVDIGEIKKLMEKLVGKTLHKTTVYRFLERHDFRKIAPRKYHPKRNKETQEEFKKKFPHSD
jgi:transposase